MRALVVSMLTLGLCLLQACGSDDSPPVTSSLGPGAPNVPPAAPGDAVPNPETAGTCGKVTSSERFGSADDVGVTTVPKEGVGGLVVDGDAVYLAGSRFASPSSGAPETTQWLARLDATRAPVWTKLYASPAVGGAIALAGSDSIVVGGFEVRRTATSTDAFLARVDKTNGNEIWRKSFLATKDQVTVAVTSIAVKGGDIFATGMFAGTVAFGTTSLTADGLDDYFVVRLDLDGNVEAAWKGGRPGADGELANGIAVAPDGDVVIAGEAAAGTISDGFVAKYSPAGVLRWGKPTGGTNGGLGPVAIDASGNVVVGGTSDNRGVVRKLDVAGNELWAKAWGSLGMGRDVTAFSIAIGADGSVLVGGHSLSPHAVDFGGGPIGGGFEPSAFVVELDADGNHRCSRAYPTKTPPPDGGSVNAGAAIQAIAFTSPTTYIAAGTYAGTLDLGNGPMPSAAGYDSFVGDFTR